MQFSYVSAISSRHDQKQSVASVEWAISDWFRLVDALENVNQLSFMLVQAFFNYDLRQEVFVLTPFCWFVCHQPNIKKF